MRRFKLTALAAPIAATALALMPVTPAAAAGPLMAAPWVAGHLLGAVTRLAMLPLVIASAAGAAQSPPYGPTAAYNTAPGGYYAPPAYYAPRGYDAPWPAYYAPGPHYSPAPAYSRAPLPYAGSPPRFQQSSRGYYAPGMRYSHSYGAQVFGQSRGFASRRR